MANWSGGGTGAASGAAVGSMFAPGIGTAIGAVAGGILGMFGNEQNLVDTQPYQDRANDLSTQANAFYDPNSMFYQGTRKNYRQQSLDGLLGLARQGRTSRAASGITSNSINKNINEQLGQKANENASNFNQQLYQQGVGYGNQLNQMANQQYGYMAQLQGGNQQQQGGFQNSLLTMGAASLPYLMPQNGGNPGLPPTPTNTLGPGIDSNNAGYQNWRNS